MVKIMENPIIMDDLGVKPTIFGNIHIGKKHIQKPYSLPNNCWGFGLLGMFFGVYEYHQKLYYYLQISTNFETTF